MQLPRYTWKSALLYLAGVVAVLIALYFIATVLFNSTPHQRVIPQPSSVSALRQ
jgi:hypothetical protein